MSEPLSPIWWVGINPAKPTETNRFKAVTYVEDRAAAATFFRVPETVVQVRVIYDWETAAMRTRKEAA